jgi:hypothetical protein
MITEQEIRVELELDAAGAPLNAGDLEAVVRRGRRRRFVRRGAAVAAMSIATAVVALTAIAFVTPDRAAAPPPSDDGAYFPIPRWLPPGAQVEGHMSTPDSPGRSTVHAALAAVTGGSISRAVTLTVWLASADEKLPPGVDVPVRTGSTVDDQVRIVRIADFSEVDPSYGGAVVEWIESGRRVSVVSAEGDVEATLAVARRVTIDSSGELTAAAVGLDVTSSDLDLLVAPLVTSSRPMPYVLVTFDGDPSPHVSIEVSQEPAGTIAASAGSAGRTVVRGLDAYIVTTLDARMIVFSLPSGRAVSVSSHGLNSDQLLPIDQLRRIAEGLDLVDRPGWVAELGVDDAGVLPTTTMSP